MWSGPFIIPHGNPIHNACFVLVDVGNRLGFCHRAGFDEREAALEDRWSEVRSDEGDLGRARHEVETHVLAHKPQLVPGTRDEKATGEGNGSATIEQWKSNGNGDRQKKQQSIADQ